MAGDRVWVRVLDARVMFEHARGRTIKSEGNDYVWDEEDGLIECNVVYFEDGTGVAIGSDYRLFSEETGGYTVQYYFVYA
jgi:hypothetical protein